MFEVWLGFLGTLVLEMSLLGVSLVSWVAGDAEVLVLMVWLWFLGGWGY